jgi:hypothetical protein
MAVFACLRDPSRAKGVPRCRVLTHLGFRFLARTKWVGTRGYPFPYFNGNVSWDLYPMLITLEGA